MCACVKGLGFVRCAIFIWIFSGGIVLEIGVQVVWAQDTPSVDEVGQEVIFQKEAGHRQQ